MKNNFNFIIILSLFSQTTYSQISFGNEQTIQQVGNGFVHVHSGDFDGDGDEDVISVLWSRLTWYENDGSGNFINTYIIEENQGTHQSIFVADLDSDGDLDILTEANLDGTNDQVVWYRNDGLGNFGSKIIITDQINTGHCVFAADLDNDGDYDVLSASVYDDKIAWYENDGNGNFGMQQVISSTTDGASSVYAADLDGDGDLDVIGAGAWDGTLSWYENLDGQGTFGAKNIITYSNLIQFAYAADLDGDGDQDIYFAAMGSNKIAWVQNDGNGNFSLEFLIDFEKDATDVYAQDFDNDGDLDIVSTADDGTVSWFENNGFGEFSEQIIISNTNNRSVYSTDIDGDGKFDILTASFYEGRIAWYKNLGYLGTDDFNRTNFTIYPNPTNGLLNIQSNEKIIKIEVMNLLGQTLLNFSNADKIDISHLSKGIYLLKIRDIEENVGIKKIIKQ
ncbi:MAG: T9SS type A sorting domain-containing protein [Moheibacter sp.]